VNYRAKLWAPDAARPVLTGLASRSDILTAGAAEACLLAGDPAASGPGLAKALAGLGPAEVIVRDGSRGCVALIDGLYRELPAPSVPVIDQIGAGDAFAAGYLADRLAGQPAETRLRTAIAAGAYSVAVPGDCEGLPHRDELAALGVLGEDADR
jgi:2-dehydro-3-deoxygluconokinase